METRAPIPRPQGRPSQDDDGLWMKMDFNPVTSHTETTRSGQSAASNEGAQVSKSAAPEVISRYYSVMDDEGADCVFLKSSPLPSTSYTAPLVPAEGVAGATVSNSSLTLTNELGDVTEDQPNPKGLHWHRGEKQVVAACNKVDEVLICAAQRESMATVSHSVDKDIIPASDEHLTSVESAKTHMDSSGRDHWDKAKEEERSNQDSEDSDAFSEGKENLNKCKKQTPSYLEETGKHVNVGDQTEKKDLMRSLDSCDDNKMASNENEKNDPTKYVSIRRDSGSSETEVPEMSVCEGLSKESEQSDGNGRIATEIQQGEQLLQRLQLVQQRHDVHMSESTSASPQDVQDVGVKEKGLSGTEVADSTAKEHDLAGDGKEDSRFVNDKAAETNLMEKEKNKKNENKDNETKARTVSSMIPSQSSEHHRTVSTEADYSDDDQSCSLESSGWAPIAAHEVATKAAPSIQHTFSAVETTMEKEIHDAVQGKQNLQRAGGVFNLADNSDVLEIPFKTNISLEPRSTTEPQCCDWQLSEQKTQRETHEDTQKEAVLAKQGKIPGGFAKGEVSQLKETKLLFEAFQQDKTEGPARHKKAPSSLLKGHIYPSVLERTRSLEMVSLKSCPVSRAHSLRLHRSSTPEREKSPDNLRSKSPTGGSWDKTRLSPYSKQDKHLRLYRSLDSINADNPMSALEKRSKCREGKGSQDPVLKQNPFFKLRPALALQPEVEKDIREAKEREEELRRQRCALYGENWQSAEEDERSPSSSAHISGVKQQSRGKLERVWPPPSKNELIKPEQTQESKVHRAGGQKAPLWQRWESGQINGQPSKEKN